MALPLRIQFEGAIYRVMNRGDRRENIYRDDEDRLKFMGVLEAACKKTGWAGACLLLHEQSLPYGGENPQPNLVEGLKWLLGIYTQPVNRRSLCQ